MSRPINFVMISPHFPTNFETFAVRLRELGFNTLGIADTPYEQLSEGLRNALTEYYRVDNMEDYDQVYRAVGYFAHKYGRIDRIESHNEYWLELDAKLRTDFNVFGYKNADMLAIKTKAQMKEVFRKAGLKVAQGRVFKDDEDAKKISQTAQIPRDYQAKFRGGGERHLQNPFRPRARTFLHRQKSASGIHYGRIY